MNKNLLKKFQSANIKNNQIELAIKTSKKLLNSLKSQPLDGQKEHSSIKIFKHFANKDIK